jgi:RNA recognition motif-containing protein
MIKDPVTKKMKSYCYVEYTNEEPVDHIESLGVDKKFVINGRTVEAGRAISVTKLREKVKHVVHISNLPFYAKEKDIQTFFEKNGIQSSNIAEVYIAKGEDEKSKGFGFVEFYVEVFCV